MVKTLEIEIEGQKVQIKEFLSSDDYFKYLSLSPVEQANIKPEDVSTKMLVDSQQMQYHLILATVINPKLDLQKLKDMDFKIQTNLFQLIQKEIFGEEQKEEDDGNVGGTVFLEPDGQPAVQL